MSTKDSSIKLPKISESPRKSEQDTKFLSLGTSLPLITTLPSSLTVKRDIKLICSWYKSWRSWQRRILLCSIASSCSRDQLKILLTSFESLQHHDFSAILVPQVAHLKEISPTHNSLRKYKEAFSESDVLKDSVDVLKPMPTIVHCPESEDFFSFQRKEFGSPLTLEYSSCLLVANRQKKGKTHKRSKTWSNIVKPSAQQLLELFKSQQSTIAKCLQDWDGHQKTWLLLEIVKLSDSEQLGYLAQCLHQRMMECRGIDVLEDHLLLNIMSYLDPKSLCRASQVCRRWYRLASSDVLWKRHCSRLCQHEGVDGLTGALEDLARGQHVDWKEAYRQLRMIVKRVKAIVVKSGLVRTSESQEDYFGLSRLPSSVLRDTLSLREMVALVRSTSSDLASPHHHILNMAPESSIARRRRLRSERMSMAVSSSMETSTSQDEHLHRQTLPSQDLPLTSNHQQMKGPDTLVEGQAVKGFCVAKDVYRRGKQLIALVPVILDSRPAVPFTPDPEGMQALILGGFLTDGDMSKPGKVLSVVKVRRIEVHDSNITCAMFDVRKIVTGSLDMTVRVHDMRSGREVSVLADHKGGVRCLQYDDAILVTGSWDTSCVVWDLIQGSKLAELNGHKDGVSSLKLTEKYIVTGSVDCTVRVWHRTTFHCVHHLRAHRGPVTCLVLEEGQLMSGSADSAVLIWDVDSGDCVGELAHPSALVAMEVWSLLSNVVT
jgi:hypothetical protein